jgi:hypothetical protein
VGHVSTIPNESGKLVNGAEKIFLELFSRSGAERFIRPSPHEPVHADRTRPGKTNQKRDAEQHCVRAEGHIRSADSSDDKHHQPKDHRGDEPADPACDAEDKRCAGEQFRIRHDMQKTASEGLWCPARECFGKPIDETLNAAVSRELREPGHDKPDAQRRSGE